MHMRQNQIPIKIPGNESPLKKSTSVTAVIHGAEDRPNNIYYVDSLQRFKRDYASVDKQERDLKNQKQQNVRDRKRMQSMQRELSLKKLEDGNYQKMKDRQSNSLHMHSMGSKLTIHSNGTAIDPLTLRYQNTQKGRQMEQHDRQKQINTLVRSHKLQTWGTSGYNIINGQRSLTVEEMVPNDNFGLFQQKLSHYYEKFRVKPQEA